MLLKPSRTVRVGLSTLFPIVHFMSVFKLIERFTNELTLLKGCQDGRALVYFLSPRPTVKGGGGRGWWCN